MQNRFHFSPTSLTSLRGSCQGRFPSSRGVWAPRRGRGRWGQGGPRPHADPPRRPTETQRRSPTLKEESGPVSLLHRKEERGTEAPTQVTVHGGLRAAVSSLDQRLRTARFHGGYQRGAGPREALPCPVRGPAQSVGLPPPPGIDLIGGPARRALKGGSPLPRLTPSHDNLVSSPLKLPWSMPPKTSWMPRSPKVTSLPRPVPGSLPRAISGSHSAPCSWPFVMVGHRGLSACCPLGAGGGRGPCVQCMSLGGPWT